jgi:hypothetical protein
MNRSSLNLLAPLALVALFSGCAQPEPPLAESTLGPRNTNAEPTSKASAGQRASRLVFVDKEHACDCTQAKIDSAWAAISAVWGRDRPAPERIHADTQAAALNTLRQKRPMVALPAVYVLDSQGEVLALLQGDVTEAKLRAAVQ